MASQLPKFTHVLELCIYARSLPTSLKFYSQTLSLGQPFFSTSRVAAFSLGPTTLLVFQRGDTIQDSPYKISGIQKGVIPGHGLTSSPSDESVELKTHFALAVERNDEVDAWEKELKGKEVKILGKVDWPKGGKSVYFEDPDGHVGEIASRGIWPHH